MQMPAVQLGDGRETPSVEQSRCRLGEGVVPLVKIVRAFLDAGYDGDFDVELIGEENVIPAEARFGASLELALENAQAWMEENVPQCGYCQPGFMMATAALLEENPNPTDEDIDKNIVNVCRCATYYRMRKAIHRAAELKSESSNPVNS